MDARGKTEVMLDLPDKRMYRKPTVRTLPQLASLNCPLWASSPPGAQPALCPQSTIPWPSRCRGKARSEIIDGAERTVKMGNLPYMLWT